MPPPLTPASSFEERRRYAARLRRKFAAANRALTQRYLDGKVSLGDWQAAMRENTKRQVGMMVITAAGGDKNAVTWQDWRRIGPELKKQYGYLDNFATQLESGDPRARAFAGARAEMYAQSTYASFWRQALPVVLPAQPGDGSTRCRTRCRCRWRIEYERNGRGRVVAVLAYWTLGIAEHCPDCEDRAGQWNPLRVVVPRGFTEDSLFKMLTERLSLDVYYKVNRHTA